MTRHEKLSATRNLAREMIQDSIIVDATAQFIALMIEEVRKSKVAPLQARVLELEQAMRPFSAAVFNDNGDVTVSTGHITRGDWLALDKAMKAKP